MEKYYKEINFIAFLKLFRTEKSVKKRRIMEGINTQSENKNRYGLILPHHHNLLVNTI